MTQRFCSQVVSMSKRSYTTWRNFTISIILEVVIWWATSDKVAYALHYIY